MYSWGKAVVQKAVQGKQNFSRYHVKNLFVVYQNFQVIMKRYLKFVRDDQFRKMIVVVACISALISMSTS